MFPFCKIWIGVTNKKKDQRRRREDKTTPRCCLGCARYLDQMPIPLGLRNDGVQALPAALIASPYCEPSRVGRAFAQPVPQNVWYSKLDRFRIGDPLRREEQERINEDVEVAMRRQREARKARFDAVRVSVI